MLKAFGPNISRITFLEPTHCVRCPYLWSNWTIGWSTFWNLPYNFQDVPHFRCWFQKGHPFLIWSNEKDPGTKIKTWPFWSNLSIFAPMTAMSMKFDAYQPPEWMPQKLNNCKITENFTNFNWKYGKLHSKVINSNCHLDSKMINYLPDSSQKL